MLEFLNPWMLGGLAAVALPIVVHLLSRRRFDVVDWGAMQFLDPSPRMKRAVTLENLWLLLLRMLVLALVAAALARPWTRHRWLAQFASTKPRDVVLIVDGSYSLGRSVPGGTQHDRVVRQAKEFVRQLRPGDAVQLIDARETPQLLLPGFTQDHAAVREALTDLVPPTGSSDLSAAIDRAGRELLETTNLQRDIVVFTDGQARAWRPGDVPTWQRWDEVRRTAAITPRLWSLTATESADVVGNWSLERPEVSRELLLPGSTVRVRAVVRCRRAGDVATRQVALEVDGRQLAGQTAPVRLGGDGETTVEFEPRLDEVGGHVLSLILNGDAVPGDDRADIAVQVTAGLSVLLLDGAPNADPTRSETFFAAAALDPGGDGRTWIRPTTQPLADFQPDELLQHQLVVLANPSGIAPNVAQALDQFLDAGGSVLVTLGDAWNSDPPAEDSLPWLPVELTEATGDAADDAGATQIADRSLQLPWQERFRRAKGAALTEVRVRRWWRGQLRDVPDDAPESLGKANVVARFVSGDPALIWQRRGRGTLAVWTTSLDADWNNLPSRPDYVAWLNELLLALAGPTDRRNVAVGEPLLLTWRSESPPPDGVFADPFRKRHPAEVLSDIRPPALRTTATRFPGVYLFEASAPQNAMRAEPFVVNCDRGESDLTPLTDAERTALTEQHAVQFVESQAALADRLLADSARTELSGLLLYALLALLVLETYSTRRIVQRAA